LRRELQQLRPAPALHHDPRLALLARTLQTPTSSYRNTSFMLPIRTYSPHTLSPHSGDRTRRDAELGTAVSRRNPAPRIAKMNCPNSRYVPRNRMK
jgi:hypothetical protein